MYRSGVCERRGSGVDRALLAVEQEALPPPFFQDVEGSTVVTVYGQRKYPDMTKEERIRACYQHACRLHEQNEYMTNSSLRARLGLSSRQISQVSVLIREAVDAGRIRLLDEEQAFKHARYVPFYA
jgi:predicted HTH transcriptional regulator